MRAVGAAGFAEVEVVNEEVAVEFGPGPGEAEGVEVVEGGVWLDDGLPVYFGGGCGWLVEGDGGRFGVVVG